MIRRLAVCALLVGACGGGAHAAGVTPDLVEASVVVVQHGTTVSVTDVVRNIGSAAAPRSRTAYMIGGVVVARRWAAPLAPGARSRASVTFAVPASVAPGPYRVIACADTLR